MPFICQFLYHHVASHVHKNHVWFPALVNKQLRLYLWYFAYVVTCMNNDDLAFQTSVKMQLRFSLCYFTYTDHAQTIFHETDHQCASVCASTKDNMLV